MRIIAAAVLILVPTTLRAADADPVRTAVERGLKRLDQGAANYVTHRQCFSCHHQAVAILVKRLDHARSQGRAFPQGPEEADADEATARWQRRRPPGKPVDLEVQAVEQVPGDHRFVVELPGRGGQARRRLQQDLRRLLVLHRQRLERPPQVPVDRPQPLLDVILFFRIVRCAPDVCPDEQHFLLIGSKRGRWKIMEALHTPLWLA